MRQLESSGGTQETPRRHPGGTQDFFAHAWHNVAQRGGCARRVRWFNSFSLTPLMGSRTSVPGTSKPAVSAVMKEPQFKMQQTQKRWRKIIEHGTNEEDRKSSKRRNPGGTQEAPRGHPGGTQETPRRHPETPIAHGAILRSHGRIRSHPEASGIIWSHRES